MKERIIGEIEHMLFDLHPEVKPYYKVINLIKNLSAEDDYPSSKSKLKRKSKVDALSIFNQPIPVTRKVRNPGHNLQTRVLTAITELGRFVRVSEIMEKIKEQDTEFSGGISHALTQLRQIGSLKNYMPTGNRKLTFWGLANWEWEGENHS